MKFISVCYNLTELEIGGIGVATKEDVIWLIQRLWEIRPQEFVALLNETQAGIGAVLKLLCQEKRALTAGELSERMQVSTARIAVLLKKMEAKQLIVRSKDSSDRRITVVALSEQGQKVVKSMQDDVYRQVEQLIDCIGMQRLREFTETANEIRQMFRENPKLPPKF